MNITLFFLDFLGPPFPLIVSPLTSKSVSSTQQLEEFSIPSNNRLNYFLSYFFKIIILTFISNNPTMFKYSL